jgi:hypothetical protein
MIKKQLIPISVSDAPNAKTYHTPDQETSDLIDCMWSLVD